MKRGTILLLALLIGVTGVAVSSGATAETNRSTIAEESARTVKGFESVDRLTVRKDQRGRTFWNEGPFTVGPDSRRDDAGSRSFWSFDISKLREKKILSAELMTVETSSGSCQERPVQVWRTSRITPRSTWRDQPDWLGRLDTRLSAHGYSSDCPMGALHFRVTSGVQFAVNHDRDLVHFGIRAGDESDPKSWKRFQANAYLSVQYLTPPTPPTELRLLDPTSDCGTAEAPTAINGTTPRLSMLLKNPDRGNADLDVEVEVFDDAVTAEPVWSIATDRSHYGGATAQVRIPEGILVDGSDYFFRARTYYWFGIRNSEVSDWSDQCWFALDTTDPPAPTVNSDDYALCGADSCPIGPLTGSFTLDVGGSTDVVRYRYWLDSQYRSLKPQFPGATTSLQVAVDEGPHTLRVWSEDLAGNWSDEVTYRFWVSS